MLKRTRASLSFASASKRPISLEGAFAVTQVDQIELKKDVLFASHTARQDVLTQRAKLGIMGERLERLGAALQQHPELITALFDPHSDYNYQEELNALADRQTIVALCLELRSL